MPIWDEAVKKAEQEELEKALESVGTGSTKSTKCPGCGDTLFFDANFGKLACRSCGSVYNPANMSLSGNFSVGDKKAAREEDADKVEYVCDSCGATIVSNKETAATFCAHCGSPTLLKRRLEHEFAPDLIIPFSVSKEDACKLFKDWIKKQKMKPSDFCANFKPEDNIMGVYVPFWLIDAEVDGELSGTGYQFTSDGYNKFSISRQSRFGLRRVPFDGSKVIDNFLMRALEPFDYGKLEYYNDNFLPGFYAERYTETPLDITETIARRLDNYGAEAGKHLMMNDYDHVDNVRLHGFSENYKCAYAMLPVWFINYKYHGVTYQFGVNGQSGEVGGDVPVSEGYKRMQIFKALSSDILFYIGALIIIGLGLSLLFAMSEAEVGIYIMLFGIFVLVALISITAYKLKWATFEQTTSLDAPPAVEEYIDTRFASKMQKHDAIIGFFSATPKEIDNMRAAVSASKIAQKSNNTTIQVLAKLWNKLIGA